MKLATSSLLGSPISKVNTSLFLFFILFFNKFISISSFKLFFSVILSMILSQSNIYGRGVCEFTWFNMGFFFKKMLFYSFAL